MKLLLLIPNLVLITIAGYNLYQTVHAGHIQANFTLLLLHAMVLLLCGSFAGLIIKSMVTFRYIETRSTARGKAYNNVTVQQQ
ncbi:hypothetical protein CHU92_07565 [Flavobacterium cyanobacteriorum]|uniref:Uncharacterized protein n=1 Tax=Flavobacterium cyanobacteriorum TaxID=2022802 RepID=A0A255Z870_9FLAO|nr:hypothetical protein [Flavobacterium cyanobacteriorum]OYQ37747.1 hypothetical protein CHU92_07565 [Flavobacterium cyanobacteriorum]